MRIIELQEKEINVLQGLLVEEKQRRRTLEETLQGGNSGGSSSTSTTPSSPDKLEGDQNRLRAAWRASEKEAMELRRQLSAQRRSLEKWKEEHVEKTMEYESLQKEMAELKRQMVAVDGENQELRAVNQAVRNEVKTLLAAMEEREEEWEEGRGRAVGASASAGCGDSGHREMQRLVDEFANVTKQLEDTKAQVVVLKAEKEEWRQIARQGDKAEEIKVALARIEDLERLCDQQKKVIEGLEEKMKVLVREGGGKEQLQEVQKAWEEERARAESAKGLVMDAEARLMDANQMVRKLKGQLEAAEHELVQQRERVVAEESKIGGLLEQIRGLDAKLGEKEEALTKVSNESLVVMKRVEEVESRHARLEEVIECERRERARVEATADARAAKFQEEMKDAKLTSEEWRTLYEAKSRTVDVVSKQLEDAHSELRHFSNQAQLNNMRIINLCRKLRLSEEELDQFIAGRKSLGSPPHQLLQETRAVLGEMEELRDSFRVSSSRLISQVKDHVTNGDAAQGMRWEEERKKLSVLLEKAEGDVSKLQLSQAQAVKEKEEILARMEMAKKELDVARGEVNRLSVVLQRMEEQEKSGASIREELEAAITCLEAQTCRRDEEKRKLTALREKADEDVSRLYKRQAGAVREKEEALQRIEQLNVELGDARSEMTRLSSVLKDVKEREKAGEQEREDLHASITRLEEELVQNRHRCEAAEQDLASTKITIQQLQAERFELHLQLDEMKTERQHRIIPGAHSQPPSTAQDGTDTMAGDGKWERECARLTAEMVALKHDFEKAITAKREVEEELVRVRAEVDEAGKGAVVLQGRMEMLESRNAVLEEELQQAKVDAQRAVDDLQAAQAKYEALQSQHDAVVEEVDVTKRLVSIEKARGDGLVEEAKQAREKMEAMMGDLMAAKVAHQASLVKCHELQCTIENLTRSDDHQQGVYQALPATHEIEELRRHNYDLKSALDDARRKTSRLEEQLQSERFATANLLMGKDAELGEAREALRATQEEAVAQISQLQNELEQMREDCRSFAQLGPERQVVLSTQEVESVRMAAAEEISSLQSSLRMAHDEISRMAILLQEERATHTCQSEQAMALENAHTENLRLAARMVEVEALNTMLSDQIKLLTDKCATFVTELRPLLDIVHEGDGCGEEEKLDYFSRLRNSISGLLQGKQASEKAVADAQNELKSSREANAKMAGELFDLREQLGEALKHVQVEGYAVVTAAAQAEELESAHLTIESLQGELTRTQKELALTQATRLEEGESPVLKAVITGVGEGATTAEINDMTGVAIYSPSSLLFTSPLMTTPRGVEETDWVLHTPTTRPRGWKAVAQENEELIRVRELFSKQLTQAKFSCEKLGKDGFTDVRDKVEAAVELALQASEKIPLEGELAMAGVAGVGATISPGDLLELREALEATTDALYDLAKCLEVGEKEKEMMVQAAERMVEQDVGALTERSRVEREQMLEENITALQKCKELLAQRDGVREYTRSCLRAQRLMLLRSNQLVERIRYRRAFMEWKEKLMPVEMK